MMKTHLQLLLIKLGSKRKPFLCGRAESGDRRSLARSKDSRKIFPNPTVFFPPHKCKTVRLSVRRAARRLPLITGD